MATLLKTPLHALHARRKARLVDFHGWEMPLQYSGILDEHRAVRTSAGLFDVSHMGRLRIQGPQRRAFLQEILPIDVDRLIPGKCRYTFLLNERGTVIDDIIVYPGREDDIIVVNASNRENDLVWMKAHLPPGANILDETLPTSLLAIQGPRAAAIVKEALGIDASGLRYYAFAPFESTLVSRTGYTGEDGFELFIHSDAAVETAERLLAAGTAPVGLGARDTLRTEAGMPLHGQDIDETTTPFEAGLNFAVDLEKARFVGQDALRAGRQPVRRRVGLILESRRIARPGYEVRSAGKPVGKVTSGTFSPTLEKPIAMAYVPAGLARAGTRLEVDVRGKAEPACVVDMPFYRRKKS